MGDSHRAFKTFEDLFGDVHRTWRRGQTVTGTFVSEGKRVTITIYPDGTTQEHEEQARGGGSYSSVYRSDGRSTSIQISGDPREFLLDAVRNSGLPFAGLLMPVVSFLVFALCNPLVV